MQQLCKIVVSQTTRFCPIAVSLVNIYNISMIQCLVQARKLQRSQFWCEIFIFLDPYLIDSGLSLDGGLDREQSASLWFFLVLCGKEDEFPLDRTGKD